MKTWQEEPGGGWRSAGICGKKFLSFSFQFHPRFCFRRLVSRGLAGQPTNQFLAELNERRKLDESESFIFKIVLLVLFIVSA